MKKLWKFSWPMPYCWCVGLFRATEEEVKNAIGKTIYLGEIEGKHSEVYGEIEEGDITLVSGNPVIVFDVPEIGINPLDYLDDDGNEDNNC